MSGGLAIAILAAGGASRFGGGKLDAQLAGKPLGRHALDAALSLNSFMPVAIVTPLATPAFALEAERQGIATLLPNPRAAEGLGTSVAAAALHAASVKAGTLVLMLADMPLVSHGTLARLAAITGRAAAVCHAGGQPGIPASFPSGWFAALQGLEGERGAGSLLREAADVEMIDIAPDELHDVDTVEALEELAALLNG